MRTIDLNADVGEGTGNDAELIPLVTSANIACGGHAGDDATMEAAARIAIESGVTIGAHPGHEDGEYFGRRELPIKPAELKDLLQRQTDRLHAIVAGLGGQVRYIKLHGALYHQVGRDEELANAAVDWLNDFHTPVGIYCMYDTPLNDYAHIYGIECSEAFPDRQYLADGKLSPRTRPGSVIHDPAEVAAQAVRLVDNCDTLCLHGDESGVVEKAKAVRTALGNTGIQLRAHFG